MYKKKNEAKKTEALKREFFQTVKINKWDGAAAKNAIDDAIRKVLTEELKCKESFLLIDTKLFICALAVGVAVYALIWDYLYPFPQSKNVLAVCVLLYFMLTTILLLYTTYVEKLVFLVVKETDGDIKRKWEVTSLIQKHDDMYYMLLLMRESTGKIRQGSLKKSFAYFIDTNGMIVQSIVSFEIKRLYKYMILDKSNSKNSYFGFM